MKVSYRSFLFGIIIITTMMLSLVINNSIGCRIAVLMLLVICIIRGKQEKYILNPYYLFAITPLSLLIYVNLSKKYMVDLSIETWIIALINMVVFIIAFEITHEYKGLSKCVGAGEGRSLINNTLILVVMGFLPTVYQSLTGQIMPLASVFTLFTTTALICAIKTKNKIVIITVLLAFVISYWNYVTKSSLLSLFLGILIGYEKYYCKSRKQKIFLASFAIAGLLVMILAFTFANQNRGVMTAADSVAYYSKYGGVKWNYNNALMMPYLYLTTPWANLQYVLETQNVRTYGLWLFKPILGYCQLDKFFKEQYVLRAMSNFNTFTFIAPHFKDFGYWGSVFSSALLGYFVKKVYSRFVLSKSPFDTACYVLVGQAVLQMFFSSEFFTQSFPFTIVIIMGMYKYLFCHYNSEELEIVN